MRAASSAAADGGFVPRRSQHWGSSAVHFHAAYLSAIAARILSWWYSDSGTNRPRSHRKVPLYPIDQRIEGGLSAWAHQVRGVPQSSSGLGSCCPRAWDDAVWISTVKIFTCVRIAPLLKGVMTPCLSRDLHLRDQRVVLCAVSPRVLFNAHLSQHLNYRTHSCLHVARPTAVRCPIEVGAKASLQPPCKSMHPVGRKELHPPPQRLRCQYEGVIGRRAPSWQSRVVQQPDEGV